uniref:Uncharacterized protein n=1 Tax=Microbacterium testaceum TaxID=2033 RepID=C6L864_MICTE|nr:hypothetical protein [Microbacterium testaceum StLB037]
MPLPRRRIRPGASAPGRTARTVPGQDCSARESARLLLGARGRPGLVRGEPEVRCGPYPGVRARRGGMIAKGGECGREIEGRLPHALEKLRVGRARRQVEDTAVSARRLRDAAEPGEDQRLVAEGFRAPQPSTRRRQCLPVDRDRVLVRGERREAVTEVVDRHGAVVDRSLARRRDLPVRRTGSERVERLVGLDRAAWIAEPAEGDSEAQIRTGAHPFGARVGARADDRRLARERGELLPRARFLDPPGPGVEGGQSQHRKIKVLGPRRLVDDGPPPLLGLGDPTALRELVRRVQPIPHGPIPGGGLVVRVRRCRGQREDVEVLSGAAHRVLDVGVIGIPESRDDVVQQGDRVGGVAPLVNDDRFAELPRGVQASDPHVGIVRETIREDLAEVPRFLRIDAVGAPRRPQGVRRPDADISRPVIAELAHDLVERPTGCHDVARLPQQPPRPVRGLRPLEPRRVIPGGTGRRHDPRECVQGLVGAAEVGEAQGPIEDQRRHDRHGLGVIPQRGESFFRGDRHPHRFRRITHGP